MIKNDINLIQKRKNKQYSSKSVVLTVFVVIILGAGMFLGITLPTKNLASIKAALVSLDTELAQYNNNEFDTGTGDTDSGSLDTEYIVKTKILSSLNEQLESLTLLSTAESNAFVYINSIESGIPSKINVSSLNMSEDKLSLYGTTVDDATLAEFLVKLRESGYFNDVFVSSSMVSMPGAKASVFNITATLSEPLNNRPLSQSDTEEISSTSKTEDNQ